MTVKKYIYMVDKYLQKQDSVGHVRINREGDEFTVTFTGNRKRRFPSFDKLLKYAIEDNDLMKIPIISETELEENLEDLGPGPAPSTEKPQFTVRWGLYCEVL